MLKRLMPFFCFWAISTMSFGQDVQPEHKVYPNPAEAEIFVDLDVFAESGKYEIQLTDLIGNVIATEIRQLPMERQVFSLDLQDLPSGYFFVRITHGESTVTKRILKE